MYKRQNPDKKVLPIILLIIPAVFAGLYSFGQIEKNKADQRTTEPFKEQQLAPKPVYIGGKYVFIGMGTEEARRVLVKPDNINSTSGSWGVHEQWVYGQTQAYLYFENGKLTSWQEHK